MTTAGPTNPEPPRRRVVLRYEDRWDELQDQLMVDRAAGLAPSAVRDAVAAWLDPGTMVEVGTLVRRATSSYRGGDAPDAVAAGAEVPADGLIAGWGRLAGTLVFVAADDPALGAPVRGAAAAAKAARMRAHALEQAAPLVEVLAAARVDPAAPGTAFVREGYGLDLDGDHEAAERLLRIAVVAGPLDEQGSFEATAAHLVVLAGPAAALFGAAGHEALALGLADAVTADLPAALRWAGAAIGTLPPSTFDQPAPPARPAAAGDAASGLLDAGWSVELAPGLGPSVRTLLGTVGGTVAGVACVAPGLVIDGPAAARLLRLVRFCEVFRLPLVFEHDGLAGPVEPSRADLDGYGALRAALAAASCPVVELTHGEPAVQRALGVRPLWSAGIDAGSEPAGGLGPFDARMRPDTVRAELIGVLAAVEVSRPRRDQDDRVRFRPPRTLQAS